MQAWKTLKDDDYSVKYPDNWTFTDVFIAKTLSPNAAKGEVDLVFVYLKDGKLTYDELTRENLMGKIMDKKYMSFTCETFEQGTANGKRAIFCVYAGELEGKKHTVYGYLAENGKKLLWIYCGAESEKYQKYLPEIDTIVSTLAFR